jgi:nucleoside-diphosphate-sugar epimerase
MEKVLVIGAGGQIGTELTRALVKKWGSDSVIATDFQESARSKFDYCTFKTLNILDRNAARTLIQEERITQIYHLAAILSASGEKNPIDAWDINMSGLLNVLELAREFKINKVFWPSSIAVFGPNSPQLNTPQEAIKNPSTVYGISKLAGEHWCEYYFHKYGVDVRSLRYPGLIGYKSIAGGGTTDYAVEIFYEAIKNKKYTCFLKPDTILPMMYMPDAIRGTIDLSEAEFSDLDHHTNFNFAAMSFSCEELAAEIKKHIPQFVIEYKPDFRQNIADSWPKSIDDSSSRKEWGWKPEYGLSKMTADMIKHLSNKF